MEIQELTRMGKKQKTETAHIRQRKKAAIEMDNGIRALDIASLNPDSSQGEQPHRDIIA